MDAFATVDDLTARWRPLTTEERERAAVLLADASNALREKAYAVGRDLDRDAMQRPSFASVLRSVTVDSVARMLNTPASDPAVTQESRSALGYSVQNTYLVPGGGVYFRKDELSRLGLNRQKVGVIEFYGNAAGNHGCAAEHDGCAHLDGGNC